MTSFYKSTQHLCVRASKSPKGHTKSQYFLSHYQLNNLARTRLKGKSIYPSHPQSSFPFLWHANRSQTGHVTSGEFPRFPNIPRDILMSFVLVAPCLRSAFAKENTHKKDRLYLTFAHFNTSLYLALIR